MNRENFDKLVEETMAATAKLLIAKGAEYAGDADRLINFKRNAIKNGQTVLEVWATYWGKHVDSINTYMARVKEEAIRQALHTVAYRATQFAAEKHPWDHLCDPGQFKKDVDALLPKAMATIDAQLSEPIEGRFHDNINYSVLCLALIKELREVNAQVDKKT